MKSAPGADETRIRRALDERGVSYAPQPPAAPERPRDWLDEHFDATATPQTRPPDPPAPPDKPAATDGGAEPHWDWQRLRHWPYARLVCGAAVALIPWYRGQSAALTWGHVLEQARAQASTGGAYVIAAVGLTVGAIWVHRRHSWIAWTVLTSAFIGAVAMAHPYDLITLITGVTK
ncbi:hypothetical protein V2S66_31330 [Streptomyces sp. V4-01]|uniref:Uncharacterized protein n=1 Tax=Actinacidiphila polyblastidii TaxID=3110430 RepID=A0ABU7PKV0_9ACTN|nr:hypothetical protein [Streptomyces sp. V4-01]